VPLPPDARLISVDDHVIEPPNLWKDRLPAKFRDAGPRFVEVEGQLTDVLGNDVSGLRHVWEYEGTRYPNFALNAVAGKPPEELGIEPFRLDQIRPGCYDAKARVADMDMDGIQAALCFPSFPRLPGTVFLQARDKEVALACIRAWNDFILEEWCAAAPDRLIPLVMLPLWDVRLSVAELERTSALGAKAVTFPETPSRLGLHSFYDGGWDPLFQAMVDTDTALCMHFGSSGEIPSTSEDAPNALWIATMGINSMIALTDLLYSPVLHKFPTLRAAYSEGGIGWIPYLLERIDFVWERHGYWNKLKMDVRPSELFRRNVWGCFISDDFGIDQRHAIGVDRICWECDYPHADSNWPNSRKLLEASLEDVPDEDARRIAELNARELLRFDADLTGHR
jgi:predicted TIM-barrel fold metal-dependent hydrolase